MANIGMEVLRIALDDAVLHQKEIDELISKPEADEVIAKLVHEQTQLLVSTLELFNRMN
ncbi:hypothetical protein [uncultured Paraglaciecola sp.]|uniref:hypothetical protein n=1 Tax=uncultured Paraglaciecola sp. TaxID=1765024 RepID=UPI0026279A03|nr:hypothetical protein [uncultured Paraglaciecola sp.]